MFVHCIWDIYGDFGCVLKEDGKRDITSCKSLITSDFLTSALLKDKSVPSIFDAAEFSAACLHIVFRTHM